MSYFPFMSIKKVIPYFCVLREGYYEIIWPIVRICVFIKDRKLVNSEFFILKRKSMDNSGGSWHKLYSKYLPVKRTWFFCLALVQDIKDLTPARGQDGKISDIQGKDFWSPTRESGGRLPLPPITQPIHSQPPCIIVIGLGVFLNGSNLCWRNIVYMLKFIQVPVKMQ